MGMRYIKMFVVKHHNDCQWWQVMDIELGEIYCAIILLWLISLTVFNQLQRNLSHMKGLMVVYKNVSEF